MGFVFSSPALANCPTEPFPGNPGLPPNPGEPAPNPPITPVDPPALPSPVDPSNPPTPVFYNPPDTGCYKINYVYENCSVGLFGPSCSIINQNNVGVGCNFTGFGVSYNFFNNDLSGTLTWTFTKVVSGVRVYSSGGGTTRPGWATYASSDPRPRLSHTLKSWKLIKLS